jgi:hypothetical protein
VRPFVFLALAAAACGGSTPKAPARKPFVETDAGSPPTVDMDAGAPVPTAEYLQARARARTFADSFTWSATPTLEQAPKELGLFGGVGHAAFAIATVEVWIKKGEFTLRAATGGVDHCLGPEVVVRGALETKTYTSPLEAGRGFFQVPRGGVETDAVRFVETTSYEAPTASVLEITKVTRNDSGEPSKVSGRFVIVVQPRSPFSPMWAAGSFVDAPVTVFAP